MLEALGTVAWLVVIAGCGWVLVASHRMVVTQGMTPVQIQAWRDASSAASAASTFTWRKLVGKVLSGFSALAIGPALCGLFFPAAMVANGAAEGISFRSAIILLVAVPVLALGLKLAPPKD